MVALFIAFRGLVCLFLHSHFLSNDAASPHCQNILGLSGFLLISVCLFVWVVCLCSVIAHLVGPPSTENAARRRAAESAASTFLAHFEAASARVQSLQVAPKCTWEKSAHLVGRELTRQDHCHFLFPLAQPPKNRVVVVVVLGAKKIRCKLN